MRSITLLTGLAVLSVVALPAAGETYLAKPTQAQIDAALDPERVKNTPASPTRGLTLNVQRAARQETAPPVPSVSLPIRFAYNSAELTPAATAMLDDLGAVLASDKYRTSRFRVVGHTDAAGSDAYNQDLSVRRAEAVYAYLGRKHGLDRRRLEVVGMGERKLVAPTNPLAAENRRVEVVNLGG
jgi:outer membrane protein OmpA-like peptidoglycan-associated protein